MFNFPFEVDHIHPAARGGSDDLSNLALACRSCNARKAVAVAGTDDQTGGDEPLFDPRADRWADHFAFDAERCELTGLTPTGWATVTRLDLNHPLQLAARDLWVRLRLCP